MTKLMNVFKIIMIIQCKNTHENDATVDKKALYF